MQMRLQQINPHPLLKGYIEKMWVFESSGRVPTDDMKLVVPNGLIKLVVLFRNGLSGKMEDGWFHLSKEHSITLIGIADNPGTDPVGLFSNEKRFIGVETAGLSFMSWK